MFDFVKWIYLYCGTWGSFCPELVSVICSSNMYFPFSFSFICFFFWRQLGVINNKCELSDPAGLIEQLRVLKSVNVDGVMVDCWWGIVEAHVPQEYNWNGYRLLFQIVHKLNLKLQVGLTQD